MTSAVIVPSKTLATTVDIDLQADPCRVVHESVMLRDAEAADGCTADARWLPIHDTPGHAGLPVRTLCHPLEP